MRGRYSNSVKEGQRALSHERCACKQRLYALSGLCQLRFDLVP